MNELEPDAIPKKYLRVNPFDGRERAGQSFKAKIDIFPQKCAFSWSQRAQPRVANHMTCLVDPLIRVFVRAVIITKHPDRALVRFI